LELIAAGERGYSPGEITRIRDEMRRMIGMWRRLLDAHLPADDGGGGGYCPECRSWGGWRRRRWPCAVWTEAHSRLMTRYPPPPPAPAPAPPVQTPVAGWAPAPSLARPLGVHVIPTPRLPAPAATPRARVPAGHPVPCAAPTPGGAGAPGGSTRVPRHARPERTGTPKTVTSAPDDDPGADVITAPAGPGPRGGPAGARAHRARHSAEGV
ncbi:MAG: hypothetical protein ACRDTE_13500, partial [Pseudonocardiaceae bacterium]